MAWPKAADDQISPWRAILPVGIATGLSLLGDTGLYTILPSHTADAGVQLAAVGILLSANRWVRLISNNSVGWLSDRLPRRALFVPAVLLGAVSTAIYALTTGFWPMLLGRLLWGISWSGIWVSGNAVVFDIAGEENRGKWVGIYQISFASGAAAGSILGGVLTDLVGMHMAMGIAASLTALGGLVALIFLPETNHRPDQPEAGSTNPAALPGSGRFSELLSASMLLGVNRIVIAGMLLSSFGAFLLDLVGDSVLIGGRVVGVATLTGLGLGASTLSTIFFTPLAGSLSDRLGSRWLVVAGGLVFGTIGFSLLALANPAAAVIGLPLIFFASSSNQGLSTALMGDLSVGTRRGRLLGMLFTVGDLGSAVGPPLAYALIPRLGTAGIYWVAAALFCGMLLLSLRWAAAAGRQALSDRT